MLGQPAPPEILAQLAQQDKLDLPDLKVIMALLDRRGFKEFKAYPDRKVWLDLLVLPAHKAI